MSPKVLLMCCEGPYQQELVRRAMAEFRVVGVVWYRPSDPKGALSSRLLRYSDPGALVRYLKVRAFLPQYERAAEPLRQALFPEIRVGFKGFPEIRVADINSPEVSEFLCTQCPDIVLVNGTNLLRKPILRLKKEIPLGIVNLHTGLSPYSRGGNCNLFMLLEEHPEMVGITVHHMGSGIDSGDIIRSEQVPMREDDNYEMVDIRTFDTGINSLLKAVNELAQGRAARVPQWEPGKLFLRRTGYLYEPHHRLAANRLLERGLVREYIKDKQRRDAGVRLVGAAS